MAAVIVEAGTGIFFTFGLACREIDVSSIDPIMTAVAVGVVDAGVCARCGAAFETVVTGNGPGPLDVGAGGDAARAVWTCIRV